MKKISENDWLRMGKAAGWKLANDAGLEFIGYMWYDVGSDEWMVTSDNNDSDIANDKEYLVNSDSDVMALNENSIYTVKCQVNNDGSCDMMEVMAGSDFHIKTAKAAHRPPKVWFDKKKRVPMINRSEA